jgi:hypothetical protein
MELESELVEVWEAASVEALALVLANDNVQHMHHSKHPIEEENPLQYHRPMKNDNLNFK